MLDGYLITSVFLAISFILVGAITLSRNPSAKLNKYFMLFSSSLALWLISNYLAGTSKTSYDVALIANRLTFIFGGFSVFSILIFVKNLVHEKFSPKAKYLAAISLFFIILGGTSLVVADVDVEPPTYLIIFGPLAIAYFLSVIICAIAAVRTLFRARKRATGALKAQIYVIQMSFAVGLGAILITNAVFPLVFGIYSLTSLGSFFSALFVVGISYAIIRHRLFDIRLIVARSLAYLLLLASLVGLYGIVVFGIADAVFAQSAFSERIVPILTAVLLAFTTPALRTTFNRLTNKLFFRDAYDPQSFLNDLNNVLVTNIELNKLLTNIIRVVEENLKAESTVFSIKKTTYIPQRIIGDKNKRFSENDIKLITKSAPNNLGSVIVTDYLGDEAAELKKVLENNGVGIMVRLAATQNYDDDSIGYILFGPKKSGNPYNKLDMRMLGIIANELVIAIQNALRFEEIEKFNITLQEKIEIATHQLRQTNEKLKQLDETKDEFISMASHQLRTPLTSVKGYLSMVLEGDTGKVPANQRKLLDQAFVSSQRMVYLIADLLNVSRLRTGKFVIETAPSNLAEVVAGEVEQLKETAESRKLTLTYEKPKEFPTLPMDETKIRQVVMNFMDNAIYYTPAGGHIVAAVKEDDKTISYTVTDDGIGVPKSEHHHLFSKFYRAGNAKKARPDGTGLGLFMAKKVVIAQGGSIIFKSEEGKGSTFGFMFAKDKLIEIGEHAAAEASKIPSTSDKKKPSGKTTNAKKQ